MATSHIIKTRVTADVKQRVAEEARRDLLTEALWLRRVIDAALHAPGQQSAVDERRPIGGRGCVPVLRPVCRTPSGAGRTRLQVRLRHEDRRLLHERAIARGMPDATYLSVLLRSHLRALAPLPRDELAVLKRSIAELGAIGRNLNQIAKAAHQSGRVTGPGREEVMSMLKICEAMRSHIKSMVLANTQSWESGDAEKRN